MFDQYNRIRVCSTVTENGKGRPLLQENYNGEVLDWNKIFSIKKDYRNKQKLKTIEECEGCHFLRNQYWDKKDYIDELLLTHWTDCNSHCIYCPVSNDEDLKSKTKHYNIIPALKDAIVKNVIKKDALIEIAGGESTIYPEFEELIRLLIDNNFTNIVLNTSGIKYKKIVAEAIQTEQLTVIVSIDAGFRETHEKIKRIDSYNAVWNCFNLYAEAQAKTTRTDLVKTKYIFIPGINDTEAEIDEFIEMNIKNGIKFVALNVESEWYKSNVDKDTSNLYKLIKYAISKLENNGIEYKLYPQAHWIVQKNEKY